MTKPADNLTDDDVVQIIAEYMGVHRVDMSNPRDIGRAVLSTTYATDARGTH